MAAESALPIWHICKCGECGLGVVMGEGLVGVVEDVLRVVDEMLCPQYCSCNCAFFPLVSVLMCFVVEIVLLSFGHSSSTLLCCFCVLWST